MPAFSPECLDVGTAGPQLPGGQPGPAGEGHPQAVWSDHPHPRLAAGTLSPSAGPEGSPLAGWALSRAIAGPLPRAARAIHARHDVSRGRGSIRGRQAASESQLLTKGRLASGDAQGQNRGCRPSSPRGSAMGSRVPTPGADAILQQASLSTDCVPGTLGEGGRASATWTAPCVRIWHTGGQVCVARTSRGHTGAWERRGGGRGGPV